MPFKPSTGLILIAAIVLHLTPTPFFKLITPSALAEDAMLQSSIRQDSMPRPGRSDGTAYISIIIDDIGHNLHRGEQVINIPASITYAIIPNTTHSDRLARYAHQAGKEVMVHLPMENTDHRPMEELALTNALSEQAFRNVFEVALSAVPHAQGLNNHMGSALTQEPEAMRWLMTSIKAHRLFFVDSRTTPKSVAAEVAQQQNVLSASRDIFLDNDRTTYSIDRQFRKLLQMAKRRKTAIAIGHPYPVTIAYLEQVVPMLAANSVRILPVSELIRYRIASRQLAASGASE